MAIRKTLGGERLGSGNRMKVDLHGYERSTHDLGNIWRSSMAPGTLVPFYKKVALPGDTWDINLDVDVKTHPTSGPLFGSFKIQLDIFISAIRNYQGRLHNNETKIGMKMSDIKLPLMALWSNNPTGSNDINNSQINPSSILHYLGYKGVGVNTTETTQSRTFNALPLLMYWDIVKNYYTNKQEEIAAVIHTTRQEQAEIVSIEVATSAGVSKGEIPFTPTQTAIPVENNDQIIIAATTEPDITQILILRTIPLSTPEWVQLSTFIDPLPIGGTPGATWIYSVNSPGVGFNVLSWNTAGDNTPIVTAPQVTTFPLENLDKMRKAILTATNDVGAFIVNNQDYAPYNLILGAQEGVQNMIQTQEGLAVKTYQSDLLNNWLSTEWIDGPGGINELTAIDTSGGSFNLDTLVLSNKVYNMLNRLAVSGGTYYDWLEVQYDHEAFARAETPVYMGGLIRELVFSEVVSNSESADQPLGTLAGKGIMAQKRKGGRVTIKVHEPSYIIGIVSLTPRIDYSQGNDWDVYALKTMADLHVPAMDEIGFQDTPTEQFAWWDTHFDLPTMNWIQKSVGKQPAWINYMTSINETHGNFAIENNEMFMTLNRRYEPSETLNIEDLTTYIDPSKYNFIFAETSLDAQNFWTQIAIDATVRRKMSAKVMPNL